MSFDTHAFNQMLADYLDLLELKLIGGSDHGHNLDVGEVQGFSFVARNLGDLGMRDVVLQVTARHGQLSQSFSALSANIGAHWMAPWSTTIVVRPFDLGPHMEHWHKHEMSGGDLFGFRLDEPTGGTDNARDVETLLTARVVSWRPDFDSPLPLKSGQGPEDSFADFIQRS